MADLDLSHLAVSAARFFTGWELLHDAPMLTRLGPGRVVMDLLRAQCRHGTRCVAPLVMTGILRHRLNTALRDADRSLADLTAASLEAELAYRPSAGPRGPMSGWAGADGGFVACHMRVRLTVTAPEGRWTGQAEGVLEWPESWGRRPVA